MAKERDQEFLEYIVKSIVDNPGDVKLERTVDEMGVLMTLKVNPADMGQLIGRQGSTAKAIRTLLRIIGIKNNARINLKIVEPEGGRQERPRQDAPAPAPAPASASASDDDKDVKNVDQVVDELKL